MNMMIALFILQPSHPYNGCFCVFPSLLCLLRQSKSTKDVFPPSGFAQYFPHSSSLHFYFCFLTLGITPVTAICWSLPQAVVNIHLILFGPHWKSGLHRLLTTVISLAWLQLTLRIFFKITCSDDAVPELSVWIQLSIKGH